MQIVKQVTHELKVGRRALDALESVSIINDWQWDNSVEKWHLELTIRIECETETYVPNLSLWYIVADDSYPKGTVKIYPSQNGNFKYTLYHQSNNGNVVDNGLWRTGALCLDLNIQATQKVGRDEEPSTADERIFWHVSRALEWILCANSEKLVNLSEPFELPDFNERLLTIVAFNEDIISYMQWESIDSTFGYVDLISNNLNKSIFAVFEFRDQNNKRILPVKWGCSFSEAEKNNGEINKGIWILINGAPVVKYWQAPNTFEELLEACKEYDFDLKSVLESLSKELRDGKRHFLLVGFPIPQTFGGENEIIHWKAIRLPILSFGKKVQKGFRENEKGYLLRDKLSVFKKNMKLDWYNSQNWNENEINNRGRVDKSLRTMNTLVIGAGSIGSAVAEILTRAGVYNMDIQDFDILEIGNLSRHSLEFSSLGKSKSKELVKYLHRLNPNSIASSIEEKFSFNEDDDQLINKYDLIIDCTGENSVLMDISKIKFERKKIFASVSIGLAAKRLYLLFQKSYYLEVNNFFDKISPYLHLEREEFKDYKFPRDGIGCWSPLFPARQDDILLAASTFIKGLERFIESDCDEEVVKIYEQYYNDEGYFCGFKAMETMYD
ncbi:ThiF family adenylyltransferase [Acetobacterium carbinolicum]|uniref:ThiF family adenylyltransferase n=1 Tax=Acetobacterium carbinolicum TaxID=52690 RepID=UPI0039C8EEE5